MNLKSKVVSGLGWMAGANFLGQLITWTITIVVMRLLSPADYGLLAMSSVFVSFLLMMASAGLGPALIQATEIDDSKLGQILGLIIILNSGLFLLLFASAPLIATYFNENRLTVIIRVLSTQLVVSSFAVIPDAMLGRELKFKTRALIDLASNIAAGILTLVLAMSGYGVWSLVAGTMLSVSTKTIGLNLFAPHIRWPKLSFYGISPMLAFGGNVTAGRILWFFYSQADMFIAGKLLGKDALGFYSVAMHLASLPVQKISGVLNQVAFPAFSKIQNDPDFISSQVLKSVRILSFFSFPILWGISSVAPELVNLFLGGKWQQAILPLQILPAIMPLRMISNFLPAAVDAVGQPSVTVKNLVVASIVMPSAFFVGGHWGLEGLCIAWILVFPMVFVSNLLRIAPAINLKALAIFKAMAKPAIAGFLMCVAIVTLRIVLPADEDTLLRLATMIGAGALVYGGAAFAFDRRGCKEVLALLRR